MAWTQTDLEKLEAAIAEGALRVKYKDKEIEYRSLNEMMKLRDKMKEEISGRSRAASRLQSDYNKGL